MDHEVRRFHPGRNQVNPVDRFGERPRYIRVCSLVEADVTVANLDEGKSSDLGAFGAPPFIACANNFEVGTPPAIVQSRWVPATPCNQGSCVCRCHRRVVRRPHFRSLPYIFIKAIHIKLQLVLIAYTAQNWSSRLLFPSAWNNFSAIRSTVVMLNSNTYRSSFPCWSSWVYPDGPRP
jgi:hypothetical protein